MVGSRATARLEALDPLAANATYFVGNSEGKIFQTYGQVLSSSIYPGIDMVFHGTRGRLEFDFRVSAGSKADQIALAFDGAREVQIDARGDLILHAGAAEIRQRMPVAYQVVNGRRRYVDANFQLDKVGHVRFSLGRTIRTASW